MYKIMKKSESYSDQRPGGEQRKKNISKWTYSEDNWEQLVWN